MTMTLIQTITLGTAATSITFSSIPATFTDLLLVFSGRNNQSSNTWGEVLIAPNSNTSNRSHRSVFGTGSTTGSDTGSDIRFWISNSSSTSNTFGSSSIYIPNYASSSAKSFSIDSVTENNASSAFAVLAAGLWNDTTAISSLLLQNGAFLLSTGTSASLYGLTKGSDGIVTTS